MLLKGTRTSALAPSPRVSARMFVVMAITILPLGLGGCKSLGLNDITGSIGQPDNASN